MFNFKAYLVLLLIISVVVMIIPSLTESASAQNCSIQICKSAVASGGTLFPFVHETNQGPSSFQLTGVDTDVDSCIIVVTPQGEVETVTEESIPGWTLDHIECFIFGVDFEVLEDGVRFECDVPPGGGTPTNGGCTFFNVSTANIPTLSEWGMIATAGGLMLFGVFFVIRRRAVAK